MFADLEAKARYATEIVPRMSTEKIKKILTEMYTRPELRSVKDDCIPVLNTELAQRGESYTAPV